MDSLIEQSTSATNDADKDNRTEAVTKDNINIFANFSAKNFHIIDSSSQPDLEQSIASSSSVEEHEEQKRFQEERRFIQELILLIQNEEFEYGVDTRADALVRRYIKCSPLLVRNWINKAYLEYFTNIPILVGLLRVIARLDYEEISPEGQTMALAALSHKDTEVKDCGVRAFESWGTSESLRILKTLHVSPQWLQKYVERVIFHLQRKHNASVH